MFTKRLSTLVPLKHAVRYIAGTNAFGYRQTRRLPNKTLMAAITSVIIANFSTSKANCEEKKPQLYYRMLGSTGLQVSVLSYGFWATFGAKEDLADRTGIDIAKQCLTVARDGGVNLFDNAEVYGTPFGEAERIMGIAIKELQEENPIKWRRSDILITTKVLYLT